MLHLPTIGKQDDPTCAYSQKAVKFKRMFGDEVTLYDLPGDKPDDNDLGAWDALNAKQAESINERAETGDLLLIPFGVCQQSIAERVDLRTVEYGIGYSGVFADHRVYESRSWQAAVEGQLQGAHQANGRFYDAVIPNYFDPDELPCGRGGDYLLYVGRLTERKGLEIVLETARRADLPLVVAGAGEYQLPDWVDYRGVVGPDERAELMGNALALLAPTLYLEPFGGVAVEAQMCGTPAITTDFGAFPETVIHAVTGYRCKRMDEFVRAVESAPRLQRQVIRSKALERFSLDAVKPQYDAYFDHLRTLDSSGFYS